MKHIPNVLSTLRLVLTPVFVWVFFACSPEYSFIVFAIASLLDVLDGYLARKWNAISGYGKIMDPLADKVLQVAGVFCLTKGGIIKSWLLLALLVAKELFILIGGAVASKKMNAIVVSNKFGKFASFFTSAVICISFFTSENGLLASWNGAINIAVYVALAFSLVAMVQYTVIAIKNYKEIK